jgi:hypothetical protein
MKNRLFFIALILVLGAGCGPVRTMTPTLPPATARPDSLYVDPARDLGPISPYVYGSNYGPWTAVPPDMIQVAFDSRITALRFPGGRWGNENDIYPSMLDTFVAFCKKVGAIPTVSVRFQNGTPEAAAALVHYANIEQKYDITYWSIGNEPDYELLNGKSFDTSFFNNHWRAIALAMKAVDPKIKLIGPELSQWNSDISKTPKYPPTKTVTEATRLDYMTEFLKANGDLVDVISVHRYPFFAPTDRTPITVDRMRQNTPEWEPMVIYLRGLVQQITGKDLPIAFTETNSDSSNVSGTNTSPDSFYNAIWYADVLGHLIQQKVFMVNQWLFSQRTTGLGLIYNSEIRPTYYVFQMYSHFGSEQVYASSGAQFVSIYAAKRTDGTLTLMVINLKDDEQHLILQVKGKKPSKAQLWLFDASHKAEDLGQNILPADGVLVLPGQSISLYAIDK